MSDYPKLRALAEDVAAHNLTADPIKERQVLSRALLAALDGLREGSLPVAPEDPPDTAGRRLDAIEESLP